MAEMFLKYKSYDDHFGLINDLAKALEGESPSLPEKRATEIEEAIQAQSSAFTREGQAFK